MARKYICTAAGAKKETGEPYSVLAAVIKTKTSSFISDRDKVYLDDLLEVGSIREIEQVVVSAE